MQAPGATQRDSVSDFHSGKDSARGGGGVGEPGSAERIAACAGCSTLLGADGARMMSG